MTPVPPVNLEVKTDRSCNNWTCCFGQKAKNKEQDSPVSMEIVETITRKYEKHRNSNGTPPLQSRSVVLVTETKDEEK